jgi:hypothetical protein
LRGRVEKVEKLGGSKQQQQQQPIFKNPIKGTFGLLC